jgi:hypothetical protein
LQGRSSCGQSRCVPPAPRPPMCPHHLPHLRTFFKPVTRFPAQHQDRPRMTRMALARASPATRGPHDHGTIPPGEMLPVVSSPESGARSSPAPRGRPLLLQPRQGRSRFSSSEGGARSFPAPKAALALLQPRTRLSLFSSPERGSRSSPAPKGATVNSPRRKPRGAAHAGQAPKGRK